MRPLRKTWLTPLLACAVGILFVAEVDADLTIYYSRAAWEADIAGEVYTEDFESETPDVYTTPYVTGHGFTLTSTAGPMNLAIYEYGMIDNTRYIHFRNFCDYAVCEGLTFTFPGADPQVGFGFDYCNSCNVWELHLPGVIVFIDDYTDGFIGVTEDSGSLESLLFFCSDEVQCGLSIDNLSHSPSSTVIEPTTWGRVKSLFR